MKKRSYGPGLNRGSLFGIALSLSIGWGIRGNFGHESGAMIAGVLSAIAVCLFSGREDWRQRVMYFALFGGLGWGLGGSISYMYPISFAGSEQWATCLYGFAATFFIGVLWAGLGGMGVALPAVMDRNRINDFMIPLMVVLATMAASHLLVYPWLTDHLLIPNADLTDGTWNRHHHPLYWYDADWFPACAALAGVCLFDLWDRRLGKWPLLLGFAIVGSSIGSFLHVAGDRIGMNAILADLLVVPLGDASAINPDTGLAFGPGAFLSNWPNFVHYYPQHLGRLLGLFFGMGVYFFRYGHWRKDSGLLLYMACGWLAAFIIIPVLGSIPFQSYGGLRLTPPRSDDWAGIMGVMFGAGIYCMRHHLKGVVFVGSLTGLAGGFSFILVPFTRALLRMPGHPYRTAEVASLFWQHYQSANWHSIMEQAHGFGHGIALAIAMGMLAVMIKPRQDNNHRKRGTEMIAILFVLFIMTWMNVFKNVEEWTSGASKVVPAMMKAPLFAFVELSASTWFSMAWMVLSAMIIALMVRYTRRPLAIIPASWLGRGQLLYLAFLWIMVIANFERALVHFHENRLITEWVIIINASIATFLIAALPGDSIEVVAQEPVSWNRLLMKLWTRLMPALMFLVIVMAVITRLLYGDAPLDAPGHNHKRWGEEAQWRIHPILKRGKHL